nr:hypothetical protein [Tanacetum cinerariifolium]
SIPSKDPYEEAAQQLLEQAPRSPEYVPNPIELEDHVPAHIPEHPEDLVPAEDEAPIEAYIPEMRAAVLSTYHSLLLSGTPPLLPIPIHVPSTSRRAKIIEADTSPQKRLLLTAPRPGCEVGESSVAAARQPRPTMARSKDRAAVRAEIEVLRRERLAYEQEMLETQARRHEWQCQTANDFAVQHIMRTQALEAGACIDTLEDTAVLYSLLSITGNSRLKMAPKRTTRSTQVPPVTPAPTATTTTIIEAQLQALIDRGVAAAMAEAEASRVRNGCYSNGSGPRLAQAVHECTYPDFLKCQPLNFKVTEGVVGLTQWFEKMEFVFNISNCTAACQVKYAACTLQGVTLTWWNSHVKTVTLEVA